MALVSIEGIYRNGVLELSEQPEGVGSARVLVTFMAPERRRPRSDRAAARARAFARMEAGLTFGGTGFDRAEIYSDRVREIDVRRGVL